MTTVSFRPASDGPLVLNVTDEGGDTLDDLPRQLRIQARSACLVVDAEWDGEFWSADLSGLDLPPRLHRASIYLRDGEAWRFAAEFNLHIKGGC